VGFYCYWELKVARGKTFPFSRLEDGQRDGLPALERSGLVWKWSDEDTRRKPCDGASLPPLPTYLVIRFGDRFLFVPYRHVELLLAAGETSISEAEAETAADRIVRVSTARR
jgi:hypothetical protein